MSAVLLHVEPLAPLTGGNPRSLLDDADGVVDRLAVLSMA